MNDVVVKRRVNQGAAHDGSGKECAPTSHDMPLGD
jgi:hypothetical protein